MINECDQLNTKPLDQTQNVMLKDTKRYFDASFQGDTVPRHIREQFQKTIEIWKNEDQMFVETRAAKNILKCIQQNNCVTITASSGVGKTAVLQHVALQMNADGYDILPLTDPGDIVKFYNQNQKTLFVFDDLCGSFSLDQTKTKIWEPVIERIEGILEDLHAKIIVACRLKVYQDDKFETLLSIFMSCVCNLLSENISLLKTEKQSIADIYLETKAHEITNYYDSYDFFPLLCLLYHKNPTFDIKDFFQNPFIFYKTQIDQLQKNGFFGKYCALALCVVFNNEITEEILTEEINMETRTIIENTCEACKLDRGTSRLILKQELDSLSNTFLKKQGTSYHNLKSQSYYTTIHDKIFDFLAKYFGQKIIDCLIKNADSSFIRERFLLERRHDMNQLMTNVPSKYYKLFMQRIIDDWSKGKLQDVFNNNNMKIPQFRQRLLCYLNELETSYQKQLVHTNDAYCNRTVMSQDYYTDVICDTVMLQCSFIGDLLMILWCCDLGVDVNQCGYLGQSPLMTASRYGHTEIVRLLLNKGANYNKCDLYGQSPVMMACRYGHVEIVKMLIDKGADYNKCNNRKESPITMACRCEHSEIVKLLLNRGADCNKCDTFSQSLLMFGSRQGHIQTVRMSNDYSKYDFRDQSPLFEAIENRRIEVIKMLLDKRADYNQYDFYGQLPLMKACENGRTEIVKMLLEKGADCTQPYNEDGSPVMIALNHGYTEIVKMLIDKGANYYTFNEFGQSPFIVVCTNDHSKIVKILIDKGADFKKCYFRCQSSLTKACIKCRTELVKMLLDKGADCNQLDNEGVSPVMIAVNHGYTEIVKMLIDKGANYNTFIELGQSPVIVASLNGLSEIVKILIDKGVDLNKCDFRG